MTPTPEDLGLFERLIRIETKLDSYNDNSSDHETRLRALETRLWRASGFACAVGLAASWLVPQLTK